MGVITDILKGIPLSAVLKEQLTQLEKDMAVLKAENAVLKSDNAILKAENADFRAKFQKIERDKTVHGDICPYCHQPKGKLLNIKPDAVFGIVGAKVLYYKCEGCDKEYDIQQNPPQ